jgi:hypothetical protein
MSRISRAFPRGANGDCIPNIWKTHVSADNRNDLNEDIDEMNVIGVTNAKMKQEARQEIIQGSFFVDQTEGSIYILFIF